MSRPTAPELYAWADEFGNVYYSQGGSSTQRHLMIYETEVSARRAQRFAPADAQLIRLDLPASDAL